jgi:hypothetical protein
MPDHDELTGLREEVAALREELRQAREVPWQQQGGGVAPMPVIPMPAPGAYGLQNLCGGAAGYPPSIVLNIPSGQPVTYDAAQMTVGATCAQPAALSFTRDLWP